MKKCKFIFFKLILSTFTFANMSISPYNFDFNLSSDKVRMFTVENTGQVPAMYTVEIDKNTPISKYLNMKKLKFVLSPNEKKEFKIFTEDFKNSKNTEILGKLKILEEQKIGGISYETNTNIGLYGYIGEIEEKFEVDFLKKKSESTLNGEIKNISERKIDILIKGEDMSGKIIFSRKIRILKGKDFNLSDLKNLKNLLNIEKVIFETKDMSKEFKL